MGLLKTIYLMLVALSVTIFCFGMIFGQRLLLMFLGKRQSHHQVHRFAVLWGQWLFKLIPGWKISTEGRENIPPPDSACVYVANHESAVDIYAIYCLGLEFRWLAKDQMFKIPLVGKAMSWAGYVPVVRGDKTSHVRALQQSINCLKNNIPMLFFPEGTRSTLGKPQAFKAGAFKIAKEQNVPIVPIVMKGAGNLLRKGTFTPNDATVKILILPAEFSPSEESVDDFTNRIQKLISDHHARL